MTGRRAELAQHPARRGDDRLHPRPQRGQGAAGRPRVPPRGDRGAGDRQGAAAGGRHRRSRVRGPRARSATRPTRSSWRPAMPTTPGTIRPTNGTRSRSTTPRAPPAIPRAWSTTIAAPPSRPTATSRNGRIGHRIRSISGPCRCSTATAGASRGPWRWSPAPSVCLRRVSARRSIDALADHDVTHMCGAPIIMQFIIGATAEERRPLDAQGRVHDRRRAAARRRDRGAGEGEFPRHPCLRPDRGLRPGDDLRVARGLGRAAEPASGRSSRRARACATPAEDGVTVMDPHDHEGGAARRRDHGRGDVPRQPRHEGLPEEPEGDPGGLRRRLVPFRRSRRAARGRLYRATRPLQGHHHLGRREHLDHRGRGRDHRAPGGGQRRRRGQARREMGRDALRLRGAEARRQRHGRGDHRPLPRQPRLLQVPALRGVPRAADDLDRQGAEIRAARMGQDCPGAPSLRTIAPP